MAQKYNFKIDTIDSKIESLVLNYNIKNDSLQYPKINKLLFTHKLEIATKKPIIYNSDRDFVMFDINDYLKLLNEQNRDSINQLLHRNGLTLKDNPRDTVNVVRIYYQ